VASVVAVSIMGGTVGGSVSNLFLGDWIHQSGYTPVFTALAFLHLAAFFVVRFALNRADQKTP
jgi:hypothetical protein